MKTMLEALPVRERPAWRVAFHSEACSLIELLAALVGGGRQIEVAQALLAHFGSVGGLTRATADEIAQVPGVGGATAARLQAALELGRRLMAERRDDRPLIRSPEEAAAVVMPRLQDLEQERLVVLLLDTRNRLMGEPVELYRGSLNTSFVRIGELFRPAIRANAAAVIVAHNHPSSDPSPSPEDVALTRAIVEAGRMLDILTLDRAP